MAQSREIEKLQRRWQENPLGLTFAPLAEAYRKDGMYAEALELLDIGLTQHPNYVPAHIVRGRCHLDAGSDPKAEAAFTQVTELDAENVIALKGLAEIAERAGRYHEAADRLERLLAFDRSNEAATEQLARVRGALATPSPGRIDPGIIELEDQGDSGSPDIPNVVLEEEPAASGADSRESGTAEPDPSEPESVDPVELGPIVLGQSEDPPGPTVSIEPIATMESDLVAETADAVEQTDSVLPGVERFLEAEPTDPGEPDTGDPLVEEVDTAAEGAGDAMAPDALDPSEGDIAEVADDDAAGVPDAAVVQSAGTELDVELFQPIELNAQPAAEYEVSPDGETFGAALPEASDEVTSDPGPAESAPGQDDLATGDEAPSDSGGMDDQVPAPSVAADAEQGLDEDEVGEALDEDAGLVVTETMAELFLKQGHRELALAVYTQLQQREPDNPRIGDAMTALVAEAEAAASAAMPSYAASATGGRSVRGLFDALLACAVPHGASGQGGPALGAVFGEGDSAAEALPPTAESGPSFDEFFGDEHTGQEGGGELPPVSGTPMPTSTDDIEEFNAWLRGLKR